MGYYASYGGFIRFTEKPKEKVIDIMTDTFENCCIDSDGYVISFGGDDEYYEDYIYDQLHKVDNITSNGEIEYVGEDNTKWRFIFKDGKWTEESGYTYYESDLPVRIQNKDEFIGQIIDVIQDTLDNPQGETIEGEWYDKIAFALENIMKNWKVFDL